MGRDGNGDEPGHDLDALADALLAARREAQHVLDEQLLLLIDLALMRICEIGVADSLADRPLQS